MNFKNFLFNTLPTYFLKADTNKNLAGEGTLQRYLQVLGDELDEDLVPLLENYLDIIDITTAPTKYINYISDVLGNPPDIFQDETLYRKLLHFIVNVYKIKGTARAYELYFSILGFNVTITELPENIARFYDDPTVFYDLIGVEYDDGCSPCSEYDLTFTSVAGSLSPVDQTTLDKLKEIVYFVEPINAKLRNLTLGIAIEDEVNICFEQNIKFSTLAVLRYDSPGTNYDNSSTSYDESSSQTVLTLPLDCSASLPLSGISVMEVEVDFEVT